MKHLYPITAVALVLAACAPEAAAVAAPPVGSPAPNFRLADANGTPVTLDQFKGKTVVLEWNNPGCPYVKKHYESGNMQRTQAAARKDGVVWLSINSGAPGKQGAGLDRNRKAVEEFKLSYPVLLDESGEVGQSYSAKTTPHMYVIDKEGLLRYAGAIDDGDPSQKGKLNYVRQALDEILAGKPVTTATSKPFGCSVKYAR